MPIEFTALVNKEAIMLTYSGLKQLIPVANKPISQYAESMWLMLQQDEPDDYVIATFEAHSVREFAEKAFDIVGLNWEDYVRVDKGVMKSFLYG
jgi:nucleoside-diphosphate-sugar epimerase